jgi:dTDP-4-dehydrorhamnose reductase
VKLLIFGGNGQLGTALTRESRFRGIFSTAVDLPEVDIADEAAAARIVEASEPDVVVNAAAYTAVDRAESEAEKAAAANRDGPLHLARLCASAKIPLIHISTDYVFDGTGRRPYTEDDPVSPLGVYGRTKADGEEAVRSRLAEHLIVRTSWLFGAAGNNFVRTMLRLGQRQPVLEVVADQMGCPTCAADLAAAVLDMAGRVRAGGAGLWGTYHFCNAGSTTWFGFAEAIFGQVRDRVPLRVEKVTPISTEAFGAPAPRPALSVLSCDRIRRRFGIVPRPWQEALADTLDQILAETNPA